MNECCTLRYTEQENIKNETASCAPLQEQLMYIKENIIVLKRTKFKKHIWNVFIIDKVNKNYSKFNF